MRSIKSIRHSAISMFCKKTFALWQSLGLHIVPNHFYQPIPDTRSLCDELWQTKHLNGIDFNEAQQLEMLSEFSQLYKEEYEKIPISKTNSPHQYYINNDCFGSVDGEILYCMIRYFKPKRIIEIGSGNSTLLAAYSVMKNRAEGHECNFTAIEPYPTKVLMRGFPGLSKLVTKKLQEIPLTEFSQLEANDILFIDSSHVLKIGSDVQYEYLEILPCLASGVLIHVHDIFLPSEYPKDWILRSHRFWNEQYILQALLMHSNFLKVLWAGSYMHLLHPDIMEQTFSSYVRGKTWPGSFWMKTS